MGPLSNLSLMRLHVETLFVHDEDGRLLYVNEPLHPEAHPPPLVFIGRTDEGAVCRFRHDAPAHLCDEVEQIVMRDAENLRAKDSALHDELRYRLEGAGLKTGNAWEGPAYYFAKTSRRGAECVVLDSSHADLLRMYFDDIIPELDAVYPCVAVVIEGHAVSLCRTVRRSSYAAEAGVNTALAYRKRGLAAEAVAHWGSLVHTQGILPMYSTSWSNAASRRVAAKLDLVQYGTDLSLYEHRL